MGNALGWHHRITIVVVGLSLFLRTKIYYVRTDFVCSNIQGKNICICNSFKFIIRQNCNFIAYFGLPFPFYQFLNLPFDCENLRKCSSQWGYIMLLLNNWNAAVKNLQACRLVGSWRSTAVWFVWEKNTVPAENLRSFTTRHGQTNRLVATAFWTTQRGRSFCSHIKFWTARDADNTYETSYSN